MLSYIVLITGFFLLVKGADFLVDGESSIAQRLHISELVIGLTVVAFGTSSPELFVNIVASLQGSTAIAIGNIIGSNIANICHILGVSGILVPIIIDPEKVKKELYWMMIVSILFWIFGFGGIINHLEGVVLFAGIIAFSINMIRNSLKERKNIKIEKSFTSESERLQKLPVQFKFSIYFLMTICGILILMLGSEWLIESATNIARTLGVSEVVIGLSLVAFGTSLPELATAIIAIIRKESEILLGNIVGSNIVNILFVGGSISTIFMAPMKHRIIAIDLPIMLGVSLVLVIIVHILKKISRLTGLLLFAIYIFYLLYIFLTQD